VSCRVECKKCGEIEPGDWDFSKDGLFMCKCPKPDGRSELHKELVRLAAEIKKKNRQQGD
jgi:hypothetical protein